MLKTLVIILLLAIASPAAAFVEEPVADRASAIRDGFSILPEASDQLGTRERQTVLEEFVEPLGKSAGAKPPYEFSFVLLKDVTDNGYSTLFLWPRIPAYDPDKSTAGGPVIVATFGPARTWTRQIVGGAFLVGLRRHGSAYDIALIREKRYRLFRWDGARFVERRR